MGFKKNTQTTATLHLYCLRKQLIFGEAARRSSVCFAGVFFKILYLLSLNIIFLYEGTALFWGSSAGLFAFNSMVTCLCSWTPNTCFQVFLPVQIMDLRSNELRAHAVTEERSSHTHTLSLRVSWEKIIRNRNTLPQHLWQQLQQSPTKALQVSSNSCDKSQNTEINASQLLSTLAAQELNTRHPFYFLGRFRGHRRDQGTHVQPSSATAQSSWMTALWTTSTCSVGS